MQTNALVSDYYARAFAMRARFGEFRDLLAAQEGWTLACKFLGGRFDLAFRFFLDAPTADRLSTILAFEEDIARIARNLPALSRFRRAG